MAENVTDNPGKSRYEVHEDGALAGSVQYERAGDTIILIHTETEPRFRGAGLAGRLVQACLERRQEAGPERGAVLPVRAGLDGRSPRLR